MTPISEFIAKRRITEVLHFTSNHGFVGCLTEKVVLSRKRLPERSHLAFVSAPTAASRQEASQYFDKSEDWLDFVNLSLSEINSSYFKFASTKWHVDGDRWWLIMSFSPELLEHDGVYFTTTNNVYSDVLRGRQINGLEALFASTIRRKPGWVAVRGGREENLPTCEQAEVLYPQALSLAFLRKVYVRSDAEQDIAFSWLTSFGYSEVDVVISPEKFRGNPN